MRNNAGVEEDDDDPEKRKSYGQRGGAETYPLAGGPEKSRGISIEGLNFNGMRTRMCDKGRSFHCHQCDFNRTDPFEGLLQFIRNDAGTEYYRGSRRSQGPTKDSFAGNSVRRRDRKARLSNRERGSL